MTKTGFCATLAPLATALEGCGHKKGGENVMRALSARNTAALLGISKATVLRLYKAGQLDGYRTTTARNAHVRIFPESIEAYKKAREQQPQTAKLP